MNDLPKPVLSTLKDIFIKYPNVYDFIITCADPVVFRAESKTNDGTDCLIIGSPKNGKTFQIINSENGFTVSESMHEPQDS